MGRIGPLMPNNDSTQTTVDEILNVDEGIAKTNRIF